MGSNKPYRVEKSRKKNDKKAKNIVKGKNAQIEGHFVSIDQLAWQPVQLPDRLDDAEGFFGLEEIDDVEVVKDAESGSIRYRTGKDNVASTVQNKAREEHLEQGSEESWEGFEEESKFEPTKQVDMEVDVEAEPESKRKQKEKKRKRKGEGEAVSDGGFEALRKADGEKKKTTDVSAWKRLGVSPDILNAMSRLGFSKPTDIQTAAIPIVRAGHDVIGKAPTGSGKTLAFGVPILEYFLENRASSGIKVSEESQSPTALILSPTRELAHQIGAHLKDLCSGLYPDGPRLATLTGGLSLHKQQRLLKNADIIIGTPGRLWEVMSSVPDVLPWMRKLQYLVVDEADRLLSEGHFKEAEEILNSLDRKDTDESDIDSDDETTLRSSITRQTLVFSATFQKELQQRLAGKGKPFKSNMMDKRESMEYLLKKLNFREERPQYVDVNPISQMAQNLKEGMIECGALEKDLYLYTLLMNYPKARTLAFTNSIASVRRIVPFLQNLRLPALALHSEMPQKARLRSVEKFTAASSGSILIATDVAARGLDIPNVELVIHYHAPRTADMYVHRSGRTARASRSGTSVILCAPEEVVPVRRLVAKVHAQAASAQEDDSSKDEPIRTLDIDRRAVGRLKPRAALAKKIADAAAAKEKVGAEEGWMRAAAEELGVDYDSDGFAEGGGGKNGRGGGRRKRVKQESEVSKGELAGWKRELAALLNQRVNLGVSEKYITAGGIDVDELLAGGGGGFLGKVAGVEF